MHPSDPLNEVRGIPDEAAIPTVFMNYQNVVTLKATTGSTGTWQYDAQLIPNPLSFGCATQIDSLGTVMTEFPNTQLATTGHVDRLVAFTDAFTQWRLAYASVTIYQDGPDLSNQGTILVCQKPVSPMILNPWFTLNGQYCGGFSNRHAFHLQQTDLPDYTVSQNMPNAYFGKSRDGAYVPLKLTKTHQAWHGFNDLIYQATDVNVVAKTDPYYGLTTDLPYTALGTITAGRYPFLGVNDLHIGATGANARLEGTLTSAFCNENWADISVRNASVNTSFSLFFRFGFECRLQPHSLLSPHLKLSPELDSSAIEAYFKISREMKDAYPADYNDLGKIWDVISPIAKTIAPALSLIPGVGPVLSGIVGTGATIGDRIRLAFKNESTPTLGNVGSLADKEKVLEVLNTPPPLPPRNPKPIQVPRTQIRVVGIKRRRNRKSRLIK